MVIKCVRCQSAADYYPVLVVRSKDNRDLTFNSVHSIVDIPFCSYHFKKNEDELLETILTPNRWDHIKAACKLLNIFKPDLISTRLSFTHISPVNRVGATKYPDKKT